MKRLIKNGLIVDGTGEKPFRADVLIERDRIAAIGSLSGGDGIKTIDAAGLTVTPGLIDGHTHSDLDVLRNRNQPNALYQGVSTIITGQCGLGFAPMRPEQYEESLKLNAGIFGRLDKYLRCWRTFDDFLGDLDGAAVNAGANVSHNAVRQMAAGFSAAPLAGKTLEAAKDALRQALQSGAVGFSIGLSYYPGGYGNTEELVELCRVVQAEGAVLCVHMRLGDNYVPLSPLEEIAAIVEKTGVRLNMLHYKTSTADPAENLFKPFERLEKAGADITYEFYPYLVGAGLTLALVPAWVLEGGGTATLERLADMKLRPRLLKEMDERYSYFFASGQTGRVILTKDPYSPDLDRTFAEIAKENGETVSETIIRLLLENDLEVGFAGVECLDDGLRQKLYDDQYRLFTDGRYTVGSDTIPTGVLCHPRAFATFPKLIKNMRSRGVPVETIIKKLTSMPARIYGLKDRGVLKPGMKADICLMDYGLVADRADFSDGRQMSDGIDSLFVNGLPVLARKTITGVFGGQVIRRGQ